MRNLEWALTRQDHDGWFLGCAFTPDHHPFTHALAYTAEGLFQPANSAILAARPSTGKTSLSLNIAANVARSAPVLIFTLESSREALFRRLLCSEARVDLAQHRAGLLTDSEMARMRKAVAYVVDLPLRICEASGATVERITAMARRAKGGEWLGLVVVDYLQLLATAGRPENRTQGLQCAGPCQACQQPVGDSAHCPEDERGCIRFLCGSCCPVCREDGR